MPWIGLKCVFFLDGSRFTKEPRSPRSRGTPSRQQSQKTGLFTQTLWEGNCFLIPENHPRRGAIGSWALLPALTGLASAPWLKLLSGSSAGFVGRSGLRDPRSHPGSLGSTEGIPCPAQSLCPSCSCCHGHWHTLECEGWPSHPLKKEEGDNAPSRALAWLRGYPVANGAKKAMGELLVPGKCRLESRGCWWCPAGGWHRTGTAAAPSRGGHVPAVAVAPAAGTGPALLAVTGCEPEVLSAVRCHLQGCLQPAAAAFQLRAVREQDSSAPGALTPAGSSPSPGDTAG